ncbi:c-type cytochrome [Hymenobacter nivis]|uniref:Cytochrome c n=1 Tax=Hymenobacter nivis TaxID=1850093 RepID=A0A502GYS9_9BACT|nr:cytochrome c [Hymenobacter nivis]TPG67211.1 cytochrome c [Hymenobacter nivis]
MRKLLFLFPARAAVVAAAALLALATGCTYSHAPEPTPCVDAAPATYAAVISPIFEAHCRECHGATVYQALGGGNDYSSYAGIKQQSASLILGCIRHDPGFTQMPKGKDQLSACDIARIQAWIDAGQPNN